MGQDEPQYSSSVSVNVELSGKYEDIVDKLGGGGDEYPGLGPVPADLQRLLETVDAIDGGTKSVIVENLPDDMTVAHDGDSVVHALQVLERYDLVVLEGNTWTVAP